MASPLRWFRKYSYFFIVVFGVLLMAIFGLGSVVTGLNPGDLARSSTRENKVVAEWAGGELKESDVFNLRQKHFAGQRLIEEVYKYALEQNGNNPFRPGVERILPIIRPGTNPSTQQMNEDVMNRYWMAKQATKEGFIVDENMVMDYLAQFSGDAGISKNILKALNKRANPGVPLTPVIRQLQTEMLWQQMESMANGGLAFNTASREGVSAINPTEAVELFARTSRQIECKVLAIPVDDYVSKVTEEPSDSELRELYEEGKFDYPSYDLKDPGFKNLKKGKLQYFIAELETFVQNEMAKITDEQVQAEYDRLLEAEDNLVMQVVPKEPQEGDAADAADSPAETPGDAPSDTPGETPVEGAPADATEAGESTGGEMVPVETPVEAVEGTPEMGEPVIDETSGNSLRENTEGAGGTSGGYTSIRVQDEVPVVQEVVQEVVPVEGVPVEGVPVEGVPVEVDAVQAETTEVPVEAAPGAEMAGDEAATDPPVQEDPTESTPAVADGSDDPSIDDGPKIEREPKPLKDVAEDIKRRMVMQDARTGRDKAVDSAEREIRKFQMLYDRWENDLEGNKDETEEPARPNYQEVADKYGIQFAETDWVDQTTIGDEQIGQVVVFDMASRQAIQIGEQLFFDFDNLAEYQPLSADDFRTSSRFLYWFSEKAEAKVPSFDEARESVLEYWKRNKAIDLAMIEAEKIAEETTNQKKLLSAAYPEKAVDTGSFAWFSKFGRFSYGAPIGVTQPGEDFMATAFELKSNECGAAMNDLRDIAYVVQNVTPVEKSTDQIASEYLKQHFFQTRQIPREVMTAKQRYRQEMNFDWSRQFRKSMDVNVVGQ